MRIIITKIYQLSLTKRMGLYLLLPHHRRLHLYTKTDRRTNNTQYPRAYEYSFEYNIRREINNKNNNHNNMTLRSRFARLSEGKEKVNRIKMKCFLKRTSRPGFASFTPGVVYNIIYKNMANPSAKSNGRELIFRILYYYYYYYTRTQTHNMYTSNTNKPQQFQRNFSRNPTTSLVIVLKTLSRRVEEKSELSIKLNSAPRRECHLRQQQYNK